MPKKPKIDRAWFEDRFKEASGSLRRYADAMGIAHSRLSRILSAEHEPTFDEIERFARDFGVSETELMERLGRRWR